jgi:hypothetical protein
MEITSNDQRSFMELLYKLGVRYIATDTWGYTFGQSVKPEINYLGRFERLTGREAVAIDLERFKDLIPANNIFGMVDLTQYLHKVDWSKVPIDTHVLVSSDGKGWYRRHFAGVRDGEIKAFLQGLSSWTAGDDPTNVCTYKFVKLVNEEALNYV